MDVEVRRQTNSSITHRNGKTLRRTRNVEPHFAVAIRIGVFRAVGDQLIDDEGYRNRRVDPAMKMGRGDHVKLAMGHGLPKIGADARQISSEIHSRNIIAPIELLMGPSHRSNAG